MSERIVVIVAVGRVLRVVRLDHEVRRAVEGDDKKRARLNCMLHYLSGLDYPDKDPRLVRPPDPLIVGQAGHVIHRSDHILGASLHPDTRVASG